MSRDEEARLGNRAAEARKRLLGGIERSKALIAQYRLRLMMLRKPAEKGRGDPAYEDLHR